MPVYFQAVLLSSPLRSAVQFFGTGLVISPFALFARCVNRIIKPIPLPNYVLVLLSKLEANISQSMLSVGSLPASASVL